MAATELRIFADYFQFAVMDEETDDDLEGAWTSETVADAIAVSEQVIGIGTQVNMHVAVTVEVLDERPADDHPDLALDAYDHVVEASLEVPTGRLAVLGTTDYLPDAVKFDVPEGFVRVRAARANLANVVQPGEDGFGAPGTEERIRLLVWPTGERAEPAVLKRWPHGRR
ncbi:hypothetical protein [Kitasatospora viridis]|uniref:Uncharacterized protein n=1 Tax=Kitasatospora viridis TaxID=281105 RepID=A0A561UI49_9ACTN|nr:hypothetical protein [Kitasatospora viridis]TWF99061.1 hypothetical protein FHX73_112897 [Kitasatospora viridis]